MVRTWVGKLRSVITPSKRAAMLGARSAQPIVASGHAPRSKGRIHDRSRPVAQALQNPLRNGGRPYMTSATIRIIRTSPFQAETSRCADMSGPSAWAEEAISVTTKDAEGGAVQFAHVIPGWPGESYRLPDLARRRRAHPSRLRKK